MDPVKVDTFGDFLFNDVGGLCESVAPADEEAFLDEEICGLLETGNVFNKDDIVVKDEYGTDAGCWFPQIPVESGNSSDSSSFQKPDSCSPTSSYAGADQTAGGETNSKRKRTDSVDVDSADPQREKRLQRNRESAALSRRRKTTMQSLMVKTRDLERANSKLNYLLACANMETQKLRAELVRYQSAGVVPGAMAGASESAVGVPTPTCAAVFPQQPTFTPPRSDVFPPFLPPEPYPPVAAALPLPRLPRASRPKKSDK